MSIKKKSGIFVCIGCECVYLCVCEYFQLSSCWCFICMPFWLRFLFSLLKKNQQASNSKLNHSRKKNPNNEKSLRLQSERNKKRKRANVFVYVILVHMSEIHVTPQGVYLWSTFFIVTKEATQLFSYFRHTSIDKVEISSADFNTRSLLRCFVHYFPQFMWKTNIEYRHQVWKEKQEKIYSSFLS